MIDIPKGVEKLCISEYIECIPPKATAQQKGVYVRDGRARFFVKAKVKKMNATWIDLLRPLRSRLEEPLKEAVAIKVIIIYPHNKTAPKRLLNEFIPHITRPDADNIEKGLFDAMTTLAFWRDDAQIFSHTTDKYRGPRTGIYIELREYKNEELLQYAPTRDKSSQVETEPTNYQSRS